MQRSSVCVRVRVRTPAAARAHRRSSRGGGGPPRACERRDSEAARPQVATRWWPRRHAALLLPRRSASPAVKSAKTNIGDAVTSPSARGRRRAGDASRRKKSNQNRGETGNSYGLPAAARSAAPSLRRRLGAARRLLAVRGQPGAALRARLPGAVRGSQPMHRLDASRWRQGPRQGRVLACLARRWEAHDNLERARLHLRIALIVQRDAP